MNVKKDYAVGWHRLVQIVASASLHVLAYASLMLDESRIPHIPQIGDQFLILFVLSFALTLLCAIARRETLSAVFISMRLLLVSVASYGLGSTVAVQVFLVISIIADSMFALPVGGTVAVSVLATVVSVAIRQPVSVWNSTNPGLAPGGKLLLGGILAVCTIMAVAIRVYRERVRRDRSNLERLYASVQNLSRAHEAGSRNRNRLGFGRRGNQTGDMTPVGFQPVPAGKRV